ncbi:MAG: enolase C-terminal domain-like protein, partial [Candidatus Latescibacterota bacterium]
PIGTVAVCHVCAAVPNFQVLEFHHLDNDIWNTLTIERDLIRNGHIQVPTTPGLGVSVDDDVVASVMKEDLGFLG